MMQRSLGLKGQQTIRELRLTYMMGHDCQERLALGASTRFQKFVTPLL